jgi:hypothetical protein
MGMLVPLQLSCILLRHIRTAHGCCLARVWPYVVSLPSFCRFLRYVVVGVNYSTILHACASETRSPLMPVIFIVPTAFEFTLFFLTGLRAWQDAKIVAHSASAPFLHVLYRDGIVCFFIMFGVRIWNIWIVRRFPYLDPHVRLQS